MFAGRVVVALRSRWRDFGFIWRDLQLPRQDRRNIASTTNPVSEIYMRRRQHDGVLFRHHVASAEFRCALFQHARDHAGFGGIDHQRWFVYANPSQHSDWLGSASDTARTISPTICAAAACWLILKSRTIPTTRPRCRRGTPAAPTSSLAGICQPAMEGCAPDAKSGGG